jgi:ABC-type lipoprotein export system ATPase subunit
MQIMLQQTVPTFLEKEKIARSQVWANDICFVPGQHVQVVAPSGSGKTSLIHFLYGMRSDYDGAVLYDNVELKKMSAEAFSVFRQQHISIVFQDLRLFAAQTVFSNINIKRVLAPYHPEEKIKEMAARLGIANKLEKPAGTCSYGEQQRIAIIRALMQPFSFLLLDEPFSHLDEANRSTALELMQEEAAARKAGIILADLKVTEHFNAARTIHL